MPLLSGKAYFSPSVPPYVTKMWVESGGVLALNESQKRVATWFFCDSPEDPCLEELASWPIVVIHARWVVESVKKRRREPIAPYVLDERYECLNSPGAPTRTPKKPSTLVSRDAVQLITPPPTIEQERRQVEPNNVQKSRTVQSSDSAFPDDPRRIRPLKYRSSQPHDPYSTPRARVTSSGLRITPASASSSRYPRRVRRSSMMSPSRAISQDLKEEQDVERMLRVIMFSDEKVDVPTSESGIRRMHYTMPIPIAFESPELNLFKRRASWFTNSTTSSYPCPVYSVSQATNALSTMQSSSDSDDIAAFSKGSGYQGKMFWASKRN
ncbi:hypothetical protein BOTBODRAFT_142984 [Botryobasidium botryosum FD-172 SS1]|uniref:BRCT domain-containing protein n=1 Tax=Botryobasidium botryosum (strain FD-172 SS1) TaxID=930990 RepID=A0A067N6Q2_BOTB1|nr:hypothetical protein BOTBODRAFT_142984 [Botryobasidium botryosum FD-172 SS1]